MRPTTLGWSSNPGSSPPKPLGMSSKDLCAQAGPSPFARLAQKSFMYSGAESAVLRLRGLFFRGAGGLGGPCSQSSVVLIVVIVLFLVSAGGPEWLVPMRLIRNISISVLAVSESVT